MYVEMLVLYFLLRGCVNLPVKIEDRNGRVTYTYLIIDNSSYIVKLDTNVPSPISPTELDSPPQPKPTTQIDTGLQTSPKDVPTLFPTLCVQHHQDDAQVGQP